MLNARRLVGLGLSLLSAYFLVGGFFVPLSVLFRDPGIVPMPEQLLGWWGVGTGLVLTLWPRRRDRGGEGR